MIPLAACVLAALALHFSFIRPALRRGGII